MTILKGAGLLSALVTIFSSTCVSAATLELDRQVTFEPLVIPSGGFENNVNFDYPILITNESPTNLTLIRITTNFIDQDGSDPNDSLGFTDLSTNNLIEPGKTLPIHLMGVFPKDLLNAATQTPSTEKNDNALEPFGRVRLFLTTEQTNPNIRIASVPEPSSTLGLGAFVGVGAILRRKLLKKQKKTIN